MKKLKIMLLSLALFAVVGGALAFKAKFNQTWCTTLAYGNEQSGYYCSFKLGTDPTTYQTCPDAPVARLTLEDVNPILKVCTTTPQGNACDITCPFTVSIKGDGQ